MNTDTPRVDAVCDYTAPEELHREAKNLERELNAANKRIAELAEWRPIESAPMDTRVLLGWFETWPNLVWRMTADIAGHANDMPAPRPFEGTRSNGWRHGQATHWIPLPQPPTEELK